MSTFYGNVSSVKSLTGVYYQVQLCKLSWLSVDARWHYSRGIVNSTPPTVSGFDARTIEYVRYDEVYLYCAQPSPSLHILLRVPPKFVSILLFPRTSSSPIVFLSAIDSLLDFLPQYP